MRSAAILLVLCACGAPAPVPSSPSSKTPAEITASAEALVQAWEQAWEVRSADKLEALYAHDLDVVVIRQGHAKQGWTDVQASLRDAVTRAASVHLTIEHLSVGALGDTAATLTATLTREINDGVSTATEKGALTMAVALRPGAQGAAWVIVAEHFSFPSQM